MVTRIHLAKSHHLSTASLLDFFAHTHSLLKWLNVNFLILLERIGCVKYAFISGNEFLVTVLEYAWVQNYQCWTIIDALDPVWSLNIQSTPLKMNIFSIFSLKKNPWNCEWSGVLVEVCCKTVHLIDLPNWHDAIESGDCISEKALISLRSIWLHWIRHKKWSKSKFYSIKMVASGFPLQMICI